MTSQLAYRLGCPVFGARSWVGEVLPLGTPSGNQLAEYARLFSAVEGNGTFYGLPAPSTFLRWSGAVPESFRFAFKVPRVITHERALAGSNDVLRRFVELLEPLGPRIGPVMIQLPPAAGSGILSRLRRFLQALPPNLDRAVELRHPDWFDQSRNERDLHRLLVEHRAERVCLDSRALFARPAEDLSTEAAQGRKPRVPTRFVGLGPNPLVRLIGRNQVSECARELSEWAEVVAAWIREGRSPLVFCHTPDEHHAPALARAFHDRLRLELPSLAPLPVWPRPPDDAGAQLTLL